MATFATGASYFNRGFDAAIVKEDLLSQNELRQLSALYQVTAYMMMGKDMSSLFNEVSALTSNSNPTLKRLANFYLLENTRMQPERTVLQAGTLVKDTLHDSPLVRGCGLRTMTNIQLPLMADFDTGPLHRCLEDSSAYVRRTAVMGVLKQYAVAPNVSSESDILDQMKKLLLDSNAAVVATTVRAMLELQYRNAPVSYVEAILDARPHLIELLDGANEWSKVYLLEGIALSMMWDCHEAVLDSHHGGRRSTYRRRQSSALVGGSRSNSEASSAFQRRASGVLSDGEDDPEAAAIELEEVRDGYREDGEETVAKVLPLTQYASPLIVLSAIRVAALYLYGMHDPRMRVPEAERARLMSRFAVRMIQPLVMLLDAPRFEMQYVVLRNVGQFLTPLFISYFSSHLSTFLVKFDDPIYVKMEKLNLMVRLANNENGSRVLGELMVYARETDAELVRTAIYSIGSLATMLPDLAAACVVQLGSLIATRVPRIVEDTVVVVQTVLRCYPGRFTDILGPLCNSLTILESPEARAAVAWVLGEYPNSVSEAVTEYLSVLVNQFMEQPRLVQFATLTALTKLYLHGANKDAKENSAVTNQAMTMLEKVLSDCTDSYLPDLRDRAFFYWRVIALDTNVAKRMMSSTEGKEVRATLWENNTGINGTQGPPSHGPLAGQPQSGSGGQLHELGSLASVANQPLRLLLGDNVLGDSTRYLTGVDDEDEEGVGAGDSSNRNMEAPRQSPPASPSGASPAHSPTTASAAAAQSIAVEKTAFTTVLAPAQGNGVQVEMMWSQVGSKLILSSRLRVLPGEDFVRHTRVLTMQINWNMFGLGVAQVFPTTVLDAAEKPVEVSVVVGCNNQKAPTPEIQVAIELEFIGVRYVVAPPIPAAFLLLPATGCEPTFFAQQWKSLGYPVWTMPPQLQERKCDASRLTTNLLRVFCLNLVHRKEMDTAALVALLLYCETMGHERVFVQATFNSRGNALIGLTIRSTDGPVAAHVGEYIIKSLCPESDQ